jgi:acyl dehydratase
MTTTAPPHSLRWSDSFDELAPGQRFTTDARVLSQADIEAFAALTGDHHPQHVDAAWAASSPFGGTIAHGLLVISAAAGLVPFDPERVMALRRVGDVVFKRPVKPGDEIRVEGAVEAVRAASDEAGLVTLAWRVVDGQGKLVCKATVDVLWRRDTFVPIPL